MTEARKGGAASALLRVLRALAIERVRQGKTLTETAAAAKVTRQSMTAWETGKAFPTIISLFLWARYLGKTIVLQDLPADAEPKGEAEHG